MVFNSQQQGVNLGNAHGKVIISTNVAEAMGQAQREIQNGVRGIGASLQGLGNSMSSVGASISGWTAPLAAVGVAGLRTAGNFQESMNEIAARTGLAGEELEKIREQALQMGADTTFSAQQASDAFLQLLTAGLSAEQATSVLPSVLDAAQASGADLGATADTVTNILSAFRLEAEDSARVVDELARAAGSSPSGMIEIGDAMIRAASSANNFGIETDELAAIMAILSKNAIRGTEAGTGLNSMLRNITRQVPATQKAWDELGVSLFDANGNARDLDTVMRELDTALDPLSMEDQTRLIQALAGAEGAATFNALRMSDGIAEMQKTMEGQQSASDIAAQRMEGFNQTLNSTLGSLQTLMIHGLTPFMEDVLTPLLKQVIKVVNAMSAWAKENPEVTKTIASVAGVLVGLGPVLFVVGKAVTLLGILIGALTSPIALVVAGVGALWVAFKNDFGGIRTFVTPIIQQFIDWMDILFSKIRTIAAYARDFGIGEALKGILGLGSVDETQQSTLEGLLVQFGMSREGAIGVVDTIIGIFSSISNAISDVVTTLRPLFTEIGTFLGNLFENVDMEQILQIGRVLLSLTNPIGIAITALQALGVDVGQIFRDGVAAATRFFGALNDGGTVFDGLRAAFGDSSFIDGLETGFNNFITFINTVVLPGLQTLADWFTTTVLPGVIDFINLTVIPGIQGFIDILKGIWTDVSPFLTDLLNWFITTGMPLIVDFINLTVVPAVQTFHDILVGIWEAVSPALTALYDWFVTTGLPIVVDFIKGPVTNVLNGLRDFLILLWPKVKVGVEMFKNKLKEIFQWLTDNVIQPFLDAISSIGDKLAEITGGYQQAAQGINALAEATPEERAGVDVWGAITHGLGLRDNGGPGRAGMPYLIGKGAQPEVFIPDTNGTFIPNFDKIMQGMGGGVSTGDIIVQANSYEDGYEAGQGAGDGLRDRLRSRGQL